MAPLSHHRSLSLQPRCHSQGSLLIFSPLTGFSRREANAHLLAPSSVVSKQYSDFKCSVAKALEPKYSQNVGFWASESSFFYKGNFLPSQEMLSCCKPWLLASACFFSRNCTQVIHTPFPALWPLKTHIGDLRKANRGKFKPQIHWVVCHRSITTTNRYDNRL